MENWKRAVVAGSVGTSAILFVKGKRPAGCADGGSWAGGAGFGISREV